MAELQPDAQGLPRHAFHAAQHAGQPLDVFGLCRRQGEAAVAREHRGDAVPRRGGCQGIPIELDVVVRVDVDEVTKKVGKKGF